MIASTEIQTLAISILSRASEVGSQTNHLGSRQRRDTGQGSSSPLTGGRILTKYLDKVNLITNYQN